MVVGVDAGVVWVVVKEVVVSMATLLSLVSPILAGRRDGVLFGR